MTKGSSVISTDPFPPPTDVETQRVGALLSTVSTRTLLHTLATLCRQNEDAGLIIAALIDRLPVEEQSSPA